MKVSGFTFLRNPHKLGYPFIESIRSVLPIVDEFINLYREIIECDSLNKVALYDLFIET